MKGISVRIIQSLSDYPGNMELCQVEEVVIVGEQFLFTTSVGVCTCLCVPMHDCVRCFFAVFALIEIISMRIEPSQRTSMLYDYLCVLLNSTSPLAFTFPASLTTESVSLAATLKSNSRLYRRGVYRGVCAFRMTF